MTSRAAFGTPINRELDLAATSRSASGSGSLNSHVVSLFGIGNLNSDMKTSGENTGAPAVKPPGARSREFAEFSKVAAHPMR